ADNQSVLSIGASDVSYSGKGPATGTGGRAKPELQVASLVTFSDGASHQGTSASSGLVAGALAVFEGAYGKLDRDAVLKLVDQGILQAKPVAATGQPATLMLPPPSSL